MKEKEGTAQNQEKVDRCGAVASTACAIHCALCAFLPATFVALGLDFLLAHEVEWLLSVVAVSFGLVALYFAWTRHRKRAVLALLSIGIVGLVVARGMEEMAHHEHHEKTAEHAEGSEEKKEASEDAESHHDEEGKHDEEGEHDSLGHLIGEGIGVFAGLTLMLGHVSNLKAMRRKED